MFEYNINIPLLQKSKVLHICNKVSNWWLNKLDASESLTDWYEGIISDKFL